MLHGKKPTRAQKNAIAAAGLDWHEWLVVNNLPEKLVIAHRETAERRVIERR